MAHQAAAITTATTRTVNDLPEDILLHILSFLPTRSAIQTSLISRKWRNLWSRLSSLYFSYSLSPSFSATTPRSASDFIHQTLLHLPHTSPPLHKFYLEFDFKEPLYSSHVDSWTLYAIHHHVRELHLDFFISTEFQKINSSGSNLLYEFPFFLLKKGCVKVLRLTKCDLTLPSNMASMGLESLRSVFLDQVYLSDEMVCDLISGCVNLECLCLEYCYGMKDVKISSLKLNELILNFFNCEDGSLEISCPNLGSLQIVGFEVGKYNLRDLSGLIEARIFFLHELQCYEHWSQYVRSIAHVEQLTVQNWWFKLLVSKDGFSGSLPLHNLKHLELRTGYSKCDLLGIAALFEQAPNLETMVLDYLCKMDDDECCTEEFSNISIDLMLPSLKQVKIKDFRPRGNMGLMLLFLHLILHGVVLEKIILVPAMSEWTNASPVVLHRRLRQVKFSMAVAKNLVYKLEEGEINICIEE